MTFTTRISAAIACAAGIVVLASHPSYSEPKVVKPATVKKAGCCGNEGHDMGGPGGGAGPYHDAEPHHAAQLERGYGPPAPFPGGLGHGSVEYGPDPVGHGPMGHGPMGYGGGPIGTGPFVGGPRMGGPGGPPPGTLGMTYRRSSRPVPTEKHPRAGIVDVSVEDAYDVDAEGMKAYRAKDGIWRLETKEPLIPGLPHIYHIKATLGEAEDSPVEYRTVRLIPGRIVDLQW